MRVWGGPWGTECIPCILTLCLPTYLLLQGRKGRGGELKNEKTSEVVKTSSKDNECMAPVISGFLQGRPRKTFALKLEGALVGSNWKDG